MILLRCLKDFCWFWKRWVFKAWRLESNRFLNDHLKIVRATHWWLFFQLWCWISNVWHLAFSLFQDRLLQRSWNLLNIFFLRYFFLLFLLSSWLRLFVRPFFVWIMTCLYNFQMGHYVNDSKNISLIEWLIIKLVNLQMNLFLITGLEGSGDCIDIWCVFYFVIQ